MKNGVQVFMQWARNFLYKLWFEYEKVKLIKCIGGSSLIVFMYGVVFLARKHHGLDKTGSRRTSVKWTKKDKPQPLKSG